MNEFPRPMPLLIRNISMLKVTDMIYMRLSQKLAVPSRLIKIV